MAKLNNVRRINPQDFSEDNQDDIQRLGYILNSFMQEVVDMSNNNVDFENLNQNFISFPIEVDSNGKPIGTDKINVNKTNPQGIQVVRLINTTNAALLPDVPPFIFFTPNGTNLVTIDKIVGLSANNKYQLSIVVY